MENLLKKEIMAVIPKYEENRGNCTEIYIDGVEPLIIDKSVKTIMRLISKHYMIDLRELKRRYGGLISSPNLVPIPLSRKDVFVPFKIRKPMYKNDGAFGYINMRYIDKIKEGSDSTLVYLSDGLYIPCLCSLVTVKKHMKNGTVVSRCYEERATMVAEDEVIYNAKIIINN